VHLLEEVVEVQEQLNIQVETKEEMVDLVLQ
jgi:hypothetical protein